eukprot:GDKI01039444.1.p1 GENE.GDKI01039444.1~~GDKI01039444.1.p1  ORF type:complete len:186 (-),score=29.99 GDKI01039444.1:247-804(-)
MKAVFTVINSQRPGGGPAPLIKNPSPKSCYAIIALNVLMCIFCSTGILVTNLIIDADCNDQFSACLIITCILGLITALWFARVATVELASDDEWFQIIIGIVIIAVLDMGGLAWAITLCYFSFNNRNQPDTSFGACYADGKVLFFWVFGAAAFQCFAVLYVMHVSFLQFTIKIVYSLHNEFRNLK